MSVSASSNDGRSRSSVLTVLKCDMATAAKRLGAVTRTKEE